MSDVSNWEIFVAGLCAGVVLSAVLYRLGGWLYDFTHPRRPAPRPPRES